MDLVWISVAGVALLTFHCYTKSKDAFIGESLKRFITEGALGLSKTRPALAHAIAPMSGRFANLDEYINSLDGSARRTLRRIHRIEDSYEWSIRKPTSRLGLEHWIVCVDHERRVRSFGLLVGTLRFIVASLMRGNVDEYRDRQTGELVCWTSTIIKGKTMRGMWFYQKTRVSKQLLWFHALLRAVERCLALNINHLDLGPSNGSPRMEEMKAKYGFLSTKDWNRAYFPNGCDYAGDYLDLTEVIAKLPSST